MQRAHQQTGAGVQGGVAGRGQELGDAEIEHLGDFTRFAANQEDVLGLEVAVNQLPAMGGLDGGGDPAQDFQRARGGQALLPLQLLPQRATLEKLHHQEGAGLGRHAEVMHRDHVRVGEAGRGPGFPPEALGSLGAPHQVLADHLHGHGALQRGVRRRIDRAHPAAPQTPVQAVALGEQPRQAHRRQGGAILGAAPDAAVVAGAALGTLFEGIPDRRRGLDRLFQQQRQAAGNRHQQVLVVAAVGFFRALGAEGEEGFGALGRHRDRHQQINPRPAEEVGLLVRELLLEPARFSLRHLQRLVQQPQQRHQLAGHGERRRRLPRRGGGQSAIARFLRLAHQQGGEFRMQRRFNLGHYPRGRLLEAARPAHFFHHFAQQALGVVALAEEAPVKSGEPLLPLQMRHRRQPAHDRIHPAAGLQDGDQGLVGVQKEIHHKDGRERGHQPDEHPARQAVLQPLADHHSDVEHPVAQNRVGK